MKITGYWAGCDNFGDRLTKYLFEDEKRKVIGVDLKYCKVIGIGSILERLLVSKTEKRKSLKPVIVFGTGYGTAISLDGPKVFQRKLECYAVRGKKTKEFIKAYGGEISDDVLLADGGLLVARMLNTSNIKKKYELGIVPHYIDFDDERFRSLQQKIKNSIILDVRENPEDFLKHLAECKRVISTAMHPCIAADALRIPNIWAYLPNANQWDMSTKFNDYYSAYGKEKKPYIINGTESEALLQLIQERYDIEDDVVREKINRLEEIYEKIIEECRKSKIEIEIVYLKKVWSKFREKILRGIKKIKSKCLQKKEDA